MGMFRNMNEIHPDEAIAVGRIQIAGADQDAELAKVTFGLNFHTKNGNYSYMVPKGGLICARLPVGKNQITSIGVIQGFRSSLFCFSVNLPIVDLKEPGRAYYIGDIAGEFKTTPRLMDIRYEWKLKVQDNLDKTRKEYFEKFPDCPKELIPSQIILNTQ